MGKGTSPSRHFVTLDGPKSLTMGSKRAHFTCLCTPNGLYLYIYITIVIILEKRVFDPFLTLFGPLRAGNGTAAPTFKDSPLQHLAIPALMCTSFRRLSGSFASNDINFKGRNFFRGSLMQSAAAAAALISCLPLRFLDSAAR